MLSKMTIENDGMITFLGSNVVVASCCVTVGVAATVAGGFRPL